MTQEYPKMLYSPDSDTVNHSGRIVHDEVDEQEWRERGFIGFEDLPEPQPELDPYDPSKEGETPVGFVATEQFDAVVERLVNAEAEIKRLHEFVVQPSSTQVGDVNQPQSADYSDLTAGQLRTLLDEKGIEYLARDSKATLISLLENSGS